MKLGTAIWTFWNKRKVSLEHPYSIAAWMLSPCPEIRAHVRANITYKHKLAMEGLLLKLFLPVNLTPEEETARKATVVVSLLKVESIFGVVKF
jgi:hypothetical protein